MPLIENITTTGGLTFQIELPITYLLDKDWSTFSGSRNGSIIYYAAAKLGNSFFLPTVAGSMYVSTDGGITWNPVENGVRPFGSYTYSSSSRLNLYSFTSSGQRLVANNGGPYALIVSNNGFNWNTGLTNSNFINIFVGYTGQIFIGVGYRSGFNSLTIYTSNDGITWTQVFADSVNKNIRMMSVGLPEIYLVPNGLDEIRYYYSSNQGLNWVSNLSAWGAVTNYGQILGYVGSYWIAFSPDVTYVRYRPAGVAFANSWGQASNNTLPLGTFNMLSYNNSVIVVVGNQGRITTVAKSVFDASPNSAIWNTVTSGTTENLLGITWDGTKFIVNGTNGTILTSENGVNWVIRRTVELVPGTPNPIVYNGFNYTNYLMLIEGIRAFASTDNGLTWSNLTNITFPSGLQSSWRYVTYGNNYYVAAVSGQNNGIGFIYSVNGLAWQRSNYMQQYNDMPYFLFYAATGPYKFISASNRFNAGYIDDSYIYGSADGTTWAQITFIRNLYISGGIWDGSKYVLSTNNGVMYSIDAISWTFVNIVPSSIISTSFIGIAFNGSIYVLVQVLNNVTTNIYASYNLTNWVLYYTYPARPTAVNYVKGAFRISTYNGVLESANGLNWLTTDELSWPVTNNINSISGDYMFGESFYLKIKPENVIQVEYLVVAGGGSGGGSVGGGGGGGGLLSGSASLAFKTTYLVTIGAGGAAVNAKIGGNSGSNSIFHTYVAEGGGGGASSRPNDLVIIAKSGGSGGGGSWYNDSTGSTSNANGGLAAPGQGFAGGNGATTSPTGFNTGAGGGGAGSLGGNATTTGIGANGGLGLPNMLTGSELFYAGGGGGGAAIVRGIGGSGVGGSGALGGGDVGGNGTTNRGGGGGGGWGYGDGRSGSGGSGVVVIRYADTEQAAYTTGNPIVSVSGGYRIYTYTGSGSFSFLPIPSIEFQYLIVAGGGGGGQQCGGGGGAGGLLYSASYAIPLGATMTVIVGAGGTTDSGGSNSSFGNITSIGGGRGGVFFAYNNATVGGNGGSGGGGASIYPDGTLIGGNGTAGQGFAGGNNGGGWNVTGRSYVSGGGGGAGAVGSNAVSGQAGNGGIGLEYFGNYYAGGGGGGVIRESGNPERGFGGLGGGGNGGKTGGTIATSGGTNTGGGGGGAGGGVLTAGTGGSGVVIIRYINTYSQAQTTGNPNFSNVGGFYTYTFTGSGSITFN